MIRTQPCKFAHSLLPILLIVIAPLLGLSVCATAVPLNSSYSGENWVETSNAKYDIDFHGNLVKLDYQKQTATIIQSLKLPPQDALIGGGDYFKEDDLLVLTSHNGVTEDFVSTNLCTYNLKNDQIKRNEGIAFKTNDAYVSDEELKSMRILGISSKSYFIEYGSTKAGFVNSWYDLSDLSVKAELDWKIGDNPRRCLTIPEGSDTFYFYTLRQMPKTQHALLGIQLNDPKEFEKVDVPHYDEKFWLVGDMLDNYALLLYGKDQQRKIALYDLKERKVLADTPYAENLFGHPNMYYVNEKEIVIESMPKGEDPEQVLIRKFTYSDGKIVENEGRTYNSLKQRILTAESPQPLMIVDSYKPNFKSLSRFWSERHYDHTQYLPLEKIFEKLAENFASNQEFLDSLPLDENGNKYYCIYTECP